jgi:hypothetical protein
MENINWKLNISIGQYEDSSLFMNLEKKERLI